MNDAFMLACTLSTAHRSGWSIAEREMQQIVRALIDRIVKLEDRVRELESTVGSNK